MSPGRLFQGLSLAIPPIYIFIYVGSRILTTLLMQSLLFTFSYYVGSRQLRFICDIQGLAERNETEFHIFTTLTNSLVHLKPSFYCVCKLFKDYL